MIIAVFSVSVTAVKWTAGRVVEPRESKQNRNGYPDSPYNSLSLFREYDMCNAPNLLRKSTQITQMERCYWISESCYERRTRTFGHRFIVVWTITVSIHIVTQAHASIQFSLKAAKNVVKNTWSCGEKINWMKDLPTWSKSHLFKNRTMFTLTSNGFDTRDFQSNRESSSRLIRGSWRFWYHRQQLVPCPIKLNPVPLLIPV